MTRATKKFWSNNVFNITDPISSQSITINYIGPLRGEYNYSESMVLLIFPLKVFVKTEKGSSLLVPSIMATSISVRDLLKSGVFVEQ